MHYIKLRRRFRISLTLLPIILVTFEAVAQTTFQADFNAGSPPLTSEVPLGNNLSLDFATSNVHLSIPIVTKAEKIPFSYTLVANAHIYQSISLGSLPYAWGIYAGFTPAVSPSFLDAKFATIYPTLSVATVANAPGAGPCVYSFIDGSGTAHPFPGIAPGPTGCGHTSPTSDLVALDSSGYTLHDGEIIDKAGNIAAFGNYQYATGCPVPESGTNTFTDPDLVQMTDSFSYDYNPPNSCLYYGETDVYQDPLSTTPILTANWNYPSAPPSPYAATYTYTDAIGTPQQYTVKLQDYTIETNFQCNNVQDIQAYSNYLPYEVDLPGGQGTYQIQYESQVSGTITGRISEVTNPTGGTVSFLYTGGNSGIQCNSAVVPQIQVTVNDNNGNSGNWIYKNYNTNSGPGNFYVTVTDPHGNQTVHFFSGTTNTSNYLGGVFPTEVQSYSGAAPSTPTNLNTGGSAPGLLALSKVCYNANFSSCYAPSTPVAYPIFQKDIYKFPVINATIKQPSLDETQFDYNTSTNVSYGNVVAMSKWGFGATLPPSNNTASTTTITYGTWGGSSCTPLGNYIVATPCEILVGNLVNGTLQNLTQHKRSAYDSKGHLSLEFEYPGSTTIPPSMQWQPQTFYSLDGVVIANTSQGGDLWQVTVPGLGGTGTAPFSSGHAVGFTITDNQVTWTLIQTAASLTWQPETPYNPNQQVNGRVVGQYVVAPANGTNCLFKLLPTTAPTIIQQPSNPQPNTSQGDYANLYYFSTSSTNNPGVWTYNGTNYTTSNLANYSEDHQKVNSILFNIGGDPSTQPMQNFPLNQGGEIGIPSAPSQDANSHYSMVALFSLNVPVATRYTIKINHDDGMLFGIDNSATRISGPTQTYETLTAMNQYTVIGGVNQNGYWSDTYLVSFPNPGQYDFEIDFFQWESEQTLSFQMAPLSQSLTFSPIPIANGTNLQSMANAPTWPAWTTSLAPSYPSITENGTYSAPAGPYSPTGGGLSWANHGPASDFVWKAGMNFTFPNTTIIDPTGNREAPYRTGYSGTTEPQFALGLDQITSDNSYLKWLNEGLAIGFGTAYVYSYNPNGVLSKVTDPGGNTTQYSDFTCGGLFPNNVTSPPDAAGQQLATTVTWDCVTATVESVTDANGNLQTWTYGDPLIRPTSFTDKDGSVTTTSYTPNTVESVMNFNGGSTTIASTSPQIPQAGSCYGPFPGVACDTAESFGTWANAANVGSTTNAATTTTDQYDSSVTILSTKVSGTAPNQVLTVTMSAAFPNNFAVGSWAMVQNTQESAINSNSYIYQVQSVSGSSFTAAVCATGEPNCPTITNYTNNEDTGLVHFNNFFSWSLDATSFGFALPSSSTISGITVTASVKTSCVSGNCQSGLANGLSAPYVSIGLITCPTCGVGIQKTVQMPISGTTAITLGGQNDLWGASANQVNTSTINNSGFGISISAWQPDLAGGPEGQMSWAVNSVTMAITYQAAGSTVSTSHVVTYLDGFGRTYLTQTKEGKNSNNWDTIETDFNVFGQVVRSTLPFVGQKGVTNSNAPGATYQYDAMGRMLTASDSGIPSPGQVSYAYNGQDVSVTLLPAPSDGEKVKVKQMEYDGLDRLASVCEVTQGHSYWPGVSCMQANPQTGYLTTYTYDSSSRLTNVLQNNNTSNDVANITATAIDTNNNLTVAAVNNYQVGQSVTLANTAESFLNGQVVAITSVSSTQFGAHFAHGQYSNQQDAGTATFYTQQERSAVFDQLGRITTLNDAESGTSSYIYDASSAPCPIYASPGDLIQKTDAAGNTICFTYDSLHRLLSANTVSGPYVANTPGKFFVYDSSNVPDPGNPFGMPNNQSFSFVAIPTNGAGQVTAAYTCSGPCFTSGISPAPPSSVITTEVVSYDALLRPVTLWESPSHGSAFMITSESYFPNGEINSLGITTREGLLPCCTFGGQISGYSGTSTFVYSLDGMGRVSNLATFINGISNTVATVNSYQPATGFPTSVNYGDGDSDSYSYDANTLRMLTYGFTIPGSNGGTWGGQLSWNPNGTLETLSYSNTIPNTGISFPTCNYQYDDLTRLSSENCGSGGAYSQSTLSFDPFGNPYNTTPAGQTTYYQSMTYNPLNNQITSFVGCGINDNCNPPYHDANGNQILPVYGGTFSWDAFGNWGASSSQNNQYNYDAFDRPVQDGFLYGGTPMFYRPDGTFFLNTGNTWPNYWAINRIRLPVPGGSDVEVTQNCNYYNCDDSNNPYPHVYAIRHADFHGSHVLGSCADASPADSVCTYNTLFFGHITDAFGNVERNANNSSGSEFGSFDGALSEFSPNSGYLLFPTRSYIQTEARFMHPEGHGSVDPLNPQSWNGYAYTVGNSLSLRDPNGTQFDLLDDSCAYCFAPLPYASYAYVSLAECYPDNCNSGANSGSSGGGGTGQFNVSSDAPDNGPQLTPQAIAVLGGAGQLATPSNFLKGFSIAALQAYIPGAFDLANDPWGFLNKSVNAITAAGIMEGGVGEPQGINIELRTLEFQSAIGTTGRFHSVAFETSLDPTSYPGLSRAAHFQEANSALMTAMGSDQSYAQAIEAMGIKLELTPTGLAPRTSPAGWTWHHAESPGTMQLVPRGQHTRGSIFWDWMHPGGQGGMATWGK
ncbi:MAG TPA: HNH endonuclease [Terriglobales bacterium]